MKLISNLVLGLNRAGLAEGRAFAEAIDVPPPAQTHRNPPFRVAQQTPIRRVP
jgi:hypothetical protein